METNIKLVEYDNDLFLIGRKFKLSIDNLSPKQVESICVILKKRNIAAVPFKQHEEYFIITECHDNISNLHIEIDSDNGRISLPVFLESKDTIKFELNNIVDRKVIEDLYMRRLQINSLKRVKDLRIISKSPNVYYEKNNLLNPDDEETESDIDVFLRYYVFEQFFNNRGLGIGIDVGVSFFTNLSVEDYFNTKQQDRFYQLKERQSTEYKGTLLYKGPNIYSRCYFEKYDGITTLSKTDAFSYKGEFYKNSYEYFKNLYINFNVSPDDKVAFVSFKNFGTKPVPAKYLYLSVSNESLEGELSQQDKLTPEQKRKYINSFWQRIGDEPFGKNYASIKKTYYIPEEECGELELPDIIFSQNQKLDKPQGRNAGLYKDYFRNKYKKLKENGCYYVPHMMERDIHFMFPSNIKESVSQKILEDLTLEVSQLTKINIEPVEHNYDIGEHLSAIYALKNSYSDGTVVFIFDGNEPSVYYNISSELKGWKIIRLTKQELDKKYMGFNANFRNKGRSNWESYITINAFRIITELGCIPYIFSESLNFETQLMIDVSEKFSHFGLGLMIFKKGMSFPIVDFIIKPNTDSRNGLINPYLLEKYFKELITKNKDIFNKYGITNMLIFRDGSENKSEYDVINNVIYDFKSNSKRILPADFDFVFVEYHKKSKKSIRLFNNYSGLINNPLEGSYLIVDDATAIIANTGEATLTQGTASPILVKSNYMKIDLLKVLNDIFLTSQLNFGNPRVAQRLTYLAKRVDDLLRDRRAQEVIKIK